MFSIPYSGVKFQIIADKSRNIKGPSDLANLKIGVIRGGAAQGPLNAVVPQGTTVVQFDDVAGCVQGLLSGQVDAIAEGWLLPGKMNQTTGTEKYEAKFDLGESHYGMAVLRGSFDLLQWVNTFIYTCPAAARHEGCRKDSRERRYGVPTIQPLSAPDRSGKLYARSRLGQKNHQDCGAGNRNEVPGKG